MAEIEPTPLSVVFVPNVVRKQGAGHLRRCTDATRELGSSAAVLLVHPWLDPEVEVFPETEIRKTPGVRFLTVSDVRSCDFVVLDFQKTPSSIVDRLVELDVRLVGWDEGGAKRSTLPYLLDSLPNLEDHPPNAFKPELLQIVRPSVDRFSQKAKRLESVLVCFGGSDPSQLTEKTVRWFESIDWTDSKRIVVVQGPLANPEVSLPPSVEVWTAVEKLADRLGEFDVFVGSWGLTAMEALSNSTPVVTINPTSYHEALAIEFGLASVGVGSIDSHRWKRALETLDVDSRDASRNLAESSVSCSAFWGAFRSSPSKCPVCASVGNPAVGRTTNKSYFLCRSCSMEYMTPFNLPPKIYSESYFFDEYQKQYGKTYLEDFDSIRAMGKLRLRQIERVAGPLRGKTLFDVGCAYGPFLAASKDAGCSPIGLDISDAPVAYVRDELGFPALARSILDLEWDEDFSAHPRPDVVTMWFVIEHFPDLDALLTKVSNLLNVGGVFAFSTPHGRGISRLFSSFKFWNESPDDHFSIWNRSNAKKVLARYGFEVERFRMTGRHPERFPGLASKKGLLFAVVSILDRWFGWGDTFEVYARKARPHP